MSNSWVARCCRSSASCSTKRVRVIAARRKATAAAGRIRVGIGGWTYAPWRDNFYPPKLPQARELEYASRQVTAIEINGTYYSTQSPKSFRSWRDATPDDFVFSLKASRFATNRKILAEAGASITRFVESGITELGPKLGPILWQLAPTKKFEPDDLGAFLELLPRTADGLPLRHVLEPRHPSFAAPEFAALAEKHGVAVVRADSDKYASVDVTSGGFAYARLQRARAEVATGYPANELDHWTATARGWSAQGDAFVFFINGAKERAPDAARAMLERLNA